MATTEPAVASVQDTVRVALRVVLPTLAGGVVKRRPLGLAVAQKLQLDRSAVHVLRRLRSRYGEGPLPATLDNFHLKFAAVP